MKNPFFSIIIPTYNRKNFLRIAIDSVFRQTFSDYELIIVDDGSTDGTKEAVKALINETGSEKIAKKVKYIYQKNKGVSGARNRGVKKSQGKFIVFLDSDDRFCKEKLEFVYAYVMKYPRYKIFHTEEIWYKNGRLVTPKPYHKKPSGSAFRQSTKLCCISPSAVAIKKDIFQTVGSFDENLPACEDYDFWLRVTSQYPVMLIPKYLTIKEGGHPDQQSKKYPAMDKFRIYALKKILESGNLKKLHYNLAYSEFKYKYGIYLKGAAKRNKLNGIDFYKNLLINLKRN